MNSDEITAIMENKYSIDCVQLVLSPHLPGKGQKTHEGAGLISQTPNGSFLLKMYCSGNISPDDVLSRLDWKAGEIIHEEYYYHLTATDINGRQWEAKSIIPDIYLGLDTNRYIVHADIRELSYSSDLYDDVPAYSAAIYFPGDINVPFNTGVAVEKIVDGQNRSSSMKLNISKFSACDMKFELEKDVDWLTLNALSNTTIDDPLLMRMTESLQFVLARTLSWSIIELIHGKKRKVRVRSSQRNVVKSRVQPPIHFQQVDPSNKVWSLFGRYLSRTKGYTKELWHPIFRWIHAVIESGCSSLDTESLILSVATEGLLRDEFYNVHYGSAQLKTQIDDTRYIIAKLGLEKTFKDRVLGFLGNMLKPRAKDFLHILKDKNLVDSKLIEEYDKLRNSSAHGELADSSKFQIHLDRCAAALVLFYHIIFLAIGYSGPYTDYSTPGYPEKEFSCTGLP
jgi:hypothetical protein